MYSLMNNVFVKTEKRHMQRNKRWTTITLSLIKITVYLQSTSYRGISRPNDVARLV